MKICFKSKHFWLLRLVFWSTPQLCSGIALVLCSGTVPGSTQGSISDARNQIRVGWYSTHNSIPVLTLPPKMYFYKKNVGFQNPERLYRMQEVENQRKENIIFTFKITQISTSYPLGVIRGSSIASFFHLAS